MHSMWKWRRLSETLPHSIKAESRWNDTVTREYICTGYKCKNICSYRVMAADKLESNILDHIRNLYRHPKVQERSCNTALSLCRLNSELSSRRT